MRFRLANRNDYIRLRDYIFGLPWVRDGKQVIYRVTVEELKSTRTLEQNSRLWALLTEISKQAPDYMGGEHHDPEVWLEYLGRRFLGVVPGPFGDGVRKSTRGLKVGEMCDFQTQIEIWAAEQFDGFSFEWEQAA